MDYEIGEPFKDNFPFTLQFGFFYLTTLFSFITGPANEQKRQSTSLLSSTFLCKMSTILITTHNLRSAIFRFTILFPWPQILACSKINNLFVLNAKAVPLLCRTTIHILIHLKLNHETFKAICDILHSVCRSYQLLTSLMNNLLSNVKFAGLALKVVKSEK